MRLVVKALNANICRFVIEQLAATASTTIDQRRHRSVRASWNDEGAPTRMNNGSGNRPNQHRAPACWDRSCARNATTTNTTRSCKDYYAMVAFLQRA